MTVIHITDLDLNQKRVLIRVDMNVPQNEDGSISDDTRIRASLPTIRYAIEKGAGVILMTHLGRPSEGSLNEKQKDGTLKNVSLAPIAARLAELLGQEVRLISDWENGVSVQTSEVVMLENIRSNVGEKQNSDALGQAYASLCAVYVNDAFGTAHRAEASTHAVAKFAPIACAGLLLAGELAALGKALKEPARPLLAIVGGSKVSTKLGVLEALCDKVDLMVVGGGISNTFVAAAGHNVGKSLYEKDMIPVVQALQAKLAAQGKKITFASDVRVGTEFGAHAQATIKAASDIQDNEEIMDYGDESIAQVIEVIKQAKTIIWNGPVGVFEFPNFRQGTEAVARAIAASDAFSIAGGGDSLAAIAMFGLDDGISYISTGGGAFLEFVEGKTLPAVEILEQRAAQQGA